MGLVVYGVRHLVPLSHDYSIVGVGVVTGVLSYLGAGVLFGLKETFVEELVQIGD
jgi:hypothetical protein